MQKKKDHLTLSTDIDDHRILYSDWIKDTPSHNQTKKLVSHATSLDNYLRAKNERNWLIPFRDTDGLRILQSD